MDIQVIRTLGGAVLTTKNRSGDNLEFGYLNNGCGLICEGTNFCFDSVEEAEEFFKQCVYLIKIAPEPRQSKMNPIHLTLEEYSEDAIKKILGNGTN